MNPAKLRHHIEVQQEMNADDEEARDTMGQHIEDWQPVIRSLPAAFIPAIGKEHPDLGSTDIVANKRQAQGSARFEIRYRDDITVDRHRILFAGKIWDIHSVIAIPDGRPIETHIEVTEIH